MIEQHEGDDVVVGTGTALRRKAAPLLEEEDVRYAGKAVSRKALTGKGLFKQMQCVKRQFMSFLG